MKKHTNKTILKRVYSECSEEDVENLIKYWENHKCYVTMDIKPEYDSDGCPLGTFEVKFTADSHEWNMNGEELVKCVKKDDYIL